MRHPWILAAAALLAAACSPQVYPMYLEMRGPSRSGITLAGKNVSVVYMDGNNQVDSLFDRQVASSLARSLEADYFDGREQVGIFRTPAVDSVSLDLMHSLVMETEGDVVFVLSSSLGLPAPETNQVVAKATSVDSAFVCPVAVPVRTQLYVYDSMGQDKVIPYKGSAVLRTMVYNSGTLTEDGLKSLALRSMAQEADEVGERISTRFLSTWTTETFSFYYYEGSLQNDIWIYALANVMEGKLATAVDMWMPFVKQGNNISRASACYNIAQAFYLMEDYGISARWLDMAEKLENVSLAPGLRKRLSQHLEK